MQKMLIVMALSLLIAFGAKLAKAESVAVANITIADPYTRATVPGQKAAGGFLIIQNNAGTDRLLSASSPFAASVQIHEMKMDGNVMQMRQLDGLDVPANGKVELKPGSYHLMLTGLKSQLKSGDVVTIELKFQKAGTIIVNFPVQAMGRMHE